MANIMAYSSHALPIALTAGLLLTGCTLPLTDSAALGAQRTQRALVGYDKTSYHYPVAVPNTNRSVEIVTNEPLGFTPTYQDYLDWKAGKTLSPPAE